MRSSRGSMEVMERVRKVGWTMVSWVEQRGAKAVSVPQSAYFPRPPCVDGRQDACATPGHDPLSAPLWLSLLESITPLPAEEAAGVRRAVFCEKSHRC